MCILSVSAGVFLEDAFSLWVSVSYKNHYIEYLECNQINQGLSDYAGYKMATKSIKVCLIMLVTKCHASTTSQIFLSSGKKQIQPKCLEIMFYYERFLQA